MSKPRSNSPFALTWLPRSSAVRLAGEQRPNLGVELVDQLGGALRRSVERLRFERRHPRRLGVGVGDAFVETVPAQHDEHAVLALVPEEQLDAVQVHTLLETVDDRGGFVVGDAAGAPVDDGAVGRERAEVAASGDVSRAQLEVEARCAQRAAVRARTARGRSRRVRGARDRSRA